MPKILTNVREDILRISRAILETEGYNAFSMREVSSRCGIALGTIYNYYRTKDEIISEIILSDWDLANKRMETVIASGASEIDKLEEIFHSLKDFVHDFHSLWLEMAMNRKNACNMESRVNRQNDYRILIKDKIKSATPSIVRNYKGDHEFLYDMLSRCFISYCQDREFDFKNFRALFRELLGLS